MKKIRIQREKACEPDIIKQNEFRLNHVRFIWDAVRLQRETTDRYFNYYLLLITTPVLAFAAILGKLHHNFDEQVIGLICLLLYTMGICFFCLYVRQRVNNLNLCDIVDAKSKLIVTNFIKPENELLKVGLLANGIRERKKKSFTADFWVNMIQTVINSFWIINSILFIDIGLKVTKATAHCAAGCWGVLSIFLHICLRDLRLYKLEKRTPYWITLQTFGIFNWRWRSSYLSFRKRNDIKQEPRKKKKEKYRIEQYKSNQEEKKENRRRDLLIKEQQKKQVPNISNPELQKQQVKIIKLDKDSPHLMRRIPKLAWQQGYCHATLLPGKRIELPQVEANFRAAIQEHSVEIFYIHDPVACGAAIFITEAKRNNRKGIQIEDIIVRECIRRMGYGAALIRFVIQLAKEREVDFLTWETENDNPNIPFFEYFDAVRIKNLLSYRLNRSKICELIEHGRQPAPESKVGYSKSSRYSIFRTTTYGIKGYNIDPTERWNGLQLDDFVFEQEKDAFVVIINEIVTCDAVQQLNFIDLILSPEIPVHMKLVDILDCHPNTYSSIDHVSIWELSIK